VAQLEARNLPVPDHMRRPAILEGGEFFMEAFWTLDKERNLSWDVGPIPFTAIDRFADRYGFKDPDDFGFLLLAIQTLDARFRDKVAAKRDAMTKKR
jgi:hypothetical protein